MEKNCGKIKKSIYEKYRKLIAERQEKKSLPDFLYCPEG
jgi:DNA-directed RNA polymerase subunit N (RpoN/RPB10)